MELRTGAAEVVAAVVAVAAVAAAVVVEVVQLGPSPERREKTARPGVPTGRAGWARQQGMAVRLGVLNLAVMSAAVELLLPLTALGETGAEVEEEEAGREGEGECRG